jgi:threonyl-tRNA synthetase
MRLLPIGERHETFCYEVAAEMKKRGVRVEVSTRAVAIENNKYSLRVTNHIVDLENILRA